MVAPFLDWFNRAACASTRIADSITETNLPVSRLVIAGVEGVVPAIRAFGNLVTFGYMNLLVAFGATEVARLARGFS